MNSRTTICNKALSSLSAKSIGSLNENSKEATLCNAHYDIIRRSVLEEGLWSFAVKRRVLNSQSEKPVFGMTNKFSKPADCIRIVSVTGSSDNRVDWVVEGRDILCNSDTINIIYIKDVVETATYSPSFADALSTRLAAEIAYPLTESQEVYTNMIQLYSAKVKQALALDGMQGRNIPVKNNSFTRGR